jgi:hypothetical protein
MHRTPSVCKIGAEINTLLKNYGVGPERGVGDNAAYLARVCTISDRPASPPPIVWVSFGKVARSVSLLFPATAATNANFRILIPTGSRNIHVPDASTRIANGHHDVRSPPKQVALCLGNGPQAFVTVTEAGTSVN